LEDPKDFLPIYERISVLNNMMSPEHAQKRRKDGWMLSHDVRSFTTLRQAGDFRDGRNHAAEAKQHLSTAISLLGQSKNEPTQLYCRRSSRLLARALPYESRLRAPAEGKTDQAVVELDGAHGSSLNSTRRKPTLRRLFKGWGKSTSHQAYVRPSKSGRLGQVSQSPWLPFGRQRRFVEAIVHYERPLNRKWAGGCGCHQQSGVGAGNLPYVSIRDGAESTRLAKQ